MKPKEIKDGASMMTFRLKGFTLIELMIVVAVIGLLSAFAVPSYKLYVDKTKFSKAIAAVTQIRDSLSVQNIADSADSEGNLTCDASQTIQKYYDANSFDEYSAPGLIPSDQIFILLVYSDCSISINKTTQNPPHVVISYSLIPLYSPDSGQLTWTRPAGGNSCIQHKLCPA